jgi:polynucleotide 5'-kinase involved in rRNA processing
MQLTNLLVAKNRAQTLISEKGSMIEYSGSSIPFPGFFAFYAGKIKDSVENFIREITRSQRTQSVVAIVVGDQKSGKTTLGILFLISNFYTHSQVCITSKNTSSLETNNIY